MITKKDIFKAFGIACWFIFLTFPLMVLKVDPIKETIDYRWHNALLVGLITFIVYLSSRLVVTIKKNDSFFKKETFSLTSLAKIRHFIINSHKPLLACCALFTISFPFIFSTYQTTIMVNALIYVVLGLGLNIVVGVAGLLDLGYVAFYAVGAYSYALLNLHFGLGFWAVLPIAALLAAFFGIMLGFPVLRLRGDYLAIVTLGFGEIIRLVLENWGEFTHGPSGISNIPRPGLFGIELSFDSAYTYLYYLMIALVIFTIFIVNRLQNSRIGRAWFALREDEIACQAMGIDKTRTKLTAFALGATWAGIVGVIFAAKNNLINPACFTFHESAIILCIVVLGGMGSIPGVIIAALVLVLLPEHLRAFAEYRWLIFGAVLVTMMRFRPKGLIGNIRRTYTLKNHPEN